MVRSIVSVFLVALVLSVVPAFAEPPPVRFEVNLGAFKHVGFGVGVNSFSVRVDSTNEDFLGRIDYGYNGVTAYLNLRVGGTG